MEAKIEVLQAEHQSPVVIEMSEDTKTGVEPYIKTKTMKEDKQKKKDVKSVEHVLKALSSLNTPEEKLAAMCKKYTEIVDENRKLQQSLKHTDKRCSVISKEKEQLQLEYNKNVLLKSKLENLCRELQKQNKSVKDESLLKIREEEERRKETQAQFQSTLSEISALMRQNNEKNTELRDANVHITKKFKSVFEQFELREQQIEKMGKQMALESQLAEAKLAKANLEAQAEREKLIAENKQLLVEIAQYQVKIQEMQCTETSLRSQVNMYTDKYDEFQNALTKSNEVFGGFKGEMEKMSKKITKLEKESLSWKKRWEVSNVALVNMVSEKQKSDEQTALLGRQLAQLQKLCRTMQAERSGLIKTLEDHNIPRPILPPIISEPASESQLPQPNTVDKVDEMAMNCKQLKQSLAQLQGQLHALTAKHTNEEENASDSKKVKSKKNKNKKTKEKRYSPTGNIVNDDEGICTPAEADKEVNIDNLEICQDVPNIEEKNQSPIMPDDQNLETCKDSTDGKVDPCLTEKNSAVNVDEQRTCPLINEHNNQSFSSSTEFVILNSEGEIPCASDASACPLTVQPQVPSFEYSIHQPLDSMLLSKGNILITDNFEKNCSLVETIPSVDSSNSSADGELTLEEITVSAFEDKSPPNPILVESLKNLLSQHDMFSDGFVKIEKSDRIIEVKDICERLSNTESLPELEENLKGENLQCSASAVAVALTDVGNTAVDALCNVEKS